MPPPRKKAGSAGQPASPEKSPARKGKDKSPARKGKDKTTAEKSPAPQEKAAEKGKGKSPAKPPAATEASKSQKPKPTKAAGAKKPVSKPAAGGAGSAVPLIAEEPPLPVAGGEVVGAGGAGSAVLPIAEAPSLPQAAGEVVGARVAVSAVPSVAAAPLVPQVEGVVSGAGGAGSEPVPPAEGDSEGAGDVDVMDPPPGCAKTKVDPRPPPFDWEGLGKLYTYLKQYMLPLITEWELAKLILGINLGLGGRAIHAGNQEMMGVNLLAHSWAPQHAIILLTSEVDGEAFIVDGNHRVSALMRMSLEQQRQVLGGTTVKCVVYAGVPANLIAILALHVKHAKLKFRACSSSFGPGTFVSNGTAVTCYGQYPLI
jgi:hypothetical protein